MLIGPDSAGEPDVSGGLLNATTVAIPATTTSNSTRAAGIHFRVRGWDTGCITVVWSALRGAASGTGWVTCVVAGTAGAAGIVGASADGPAPSPGPDVGRVCRSLRSRSPEASAGPSTLLSATMRPFAVVIGLALWRGGSPRIWSQTLSS